MKLPHLVGLLLLIHASPQPASAQRQPLGDGPPPQAYVDCVGRTAGEAVLHTTPQGRVQAICRESGKGLAAQPIAPRLPVSERPTLSASPTHYSIEQATSDQAQLHTIAFDALAFLTGDFASDTFLPPGKVSDYFGFQFMRDLDVRGAGHNTSFLTRIAFNMLSVLDASQRASLQALGVSQNDDIRRFALRRLPLMAAFRRSLQSAEPALSQLSRPAVMAYSASLYELDGELAYQRAEVMAKLLRSLSPSQKVRLQSLKFSDSATWPELVEPMDRRQMSHEVHVAVMTYASEMFSWYAGSLEADAYFCPERHGMYFGGFGMKTAPAMGKPNHSISTSLTADAGALFLAALTPTQRQHITGLVDLQRADLKSIVEVRRQIAKELRQFLDGGRADHERVIALSRRYGELDGSLSYHYASAFARVGQTLTGSQRQRIQALRHTDASDPRGPFLYSTPMDKMSVDGVEQFFAR